MRRFRSFLNRMQLEEVCMVGRGFTWSNERENPTLELLDRMFGNAEWFAAFLNHILKPLSTDCSDHCPLLIQLHAFTDGKRRFRFEPFWPKFPGFAEVVDSAWNIDLPNVDPFRRLDAKFRNVAKELTRWSNRRMGSVRLQLTLVREAILSLDIEQERRLLEPWETTLRRSLKVRVLGLASLSRTIARQRSRMLFLAEGDANTRFYHLQACHRRRQNRIESLNVDGTQVVQDHAMAEALYAYYNEVLGSNFERSRRFDLNVIGVPVTDLSALEILFTEEEVSSVIKEMPNDKAPGPDDFTGAFYKVAWQTIKADIMHAINAFWAQDSRSLYHVNDAYMILLKKRDSLAEIRDYRPISLIHSFGKLVTKCMATRLLSVLDQLVMPNQSAFIKGRSIHD